MYRSTFSLLWQQLELNKENKHLGRFTADERVPVSNGLDDVEKWKFLPLPGLELRPLDRPYCSKSLYWLLHRGAIIKNRALYILGVGYILVVPYIYIVIVRE
jgi:hypothetical protein